MLIVQKTVESSTMLDTVLVGDDTDLLVLLCYHANLDSHKILFRPEPKKNTKNPRVWNIKAVKKQLGLEVCNNILFLHAVLGCDTTSQLYGNLDGNGKGTSLKFKSSKHFQEQAKVFAVESATLKDISAAGEQVLVNVYNGTPGESLDSLRYKRLCEKVATKLYYVYSSPDSTTNFSCCKIPYYYYFIIIYLICQRDHSLRVYF